MRDERVRVRSARAKVSAMSLWFAPLVPLVALVYALVTAPRPVPLGEGTPEARARIGRAARLAEAGFRHKALEDFPADPWSQGDDFGARERGWVRRRAKREGMRPGAVFLAIDADVRTHPVLRHSVEPERARVPPCMPRVFYH